MRVFLETPLRYDFVKSVTDHGWYMLSPFSWNDKSSTLNRIERLDNGKIVFLQISYDLSSGVQNTRGETKRGKLIVDIQSSDRLDNTSINEIKTKVRYILRLNDDLKEFYDLCQNNGALSSVIKEGRGRLLRSSTLFEDVVKVICTTNTTWNQTKSMVQRIVDKLGESFPLHPALHAFPTPEQVARVDLDYFQKHVRLGYRNEYVLRFARDIVSGNLKLDRYDNPYIISAQLKKELKLIKGIGDYSAHTLMMILGRYDEIAVDSEFRTYVKNKYFNGKNVADKTMTRLYESWGKWKYLAFWLEREE